MLVLTRKAGQKIRIGDNVILTVVRIQRDHVRIGIEAPPEIPVYREEVYLRVKSGVPAPSREGDRLP